MCRQVSPSRVQLKSSNSLETSLHCLVCRYGEQLGHASRAAVWPSSPSAHSDLRAQTSSASLGSLGRCSLAVRLSADADFVMPPHLACWSQHPAAAVDHPSARS